MKNISLTIENNGQNSYKSQFVEDLLEGSKLRETAIIIVNVYDAKHLTKIKFGTNGFMKDDFQIEIRNGNLFLYAEKSGNLENEKNKGCSFGIDTFSKTFILTSNIDVSGIKAHFTDAMLVIDLPKKRFPGNQMIH